MKLADFNSLVCPGQKYRLHLTDGSEFDGTLIALDDTLVGLDDVFGFYGRGGMTCTADRALFPLANISWMSPVPAAPTTTTTGYGQQEDA